MVFFLFCSMPTNSKHDVHVGFLRGLVVKLLSSIYNIAKYIICVPSIIYYNNSIHMFRAKWQRRSGRALPNHNNNIILLCRRRTTTRALLVTTPNRFDYSARVRCSENILLRIIIGPTSCPIGKPTFGPGELYRTYIELYRTLGPRHILTIWFSGF